MPHLIKPALTIPFVLLFLCQACEGQRVRLEVRMGPNDQAQAKARFEQRGNRIKFNVELEDAAANTNFQVTVNRGGTLVFSRSLRTNGVGFGEIDLDNTEGDRLPVMASGDLVTIRAANGQQMQGRLRSRR